MCSVTGALNEACVAGGNCPGRTITQQQALNRKVWQLSSRVSSFTSRLHPDCRDTQLSSEPRMGKKNVVVIFAARTDDGWSSGRGLWRGLGGWRRLVERRAHTIFFKHQRLFPPAQHTMHHASRAQTHTHAHTPTPLHASAPTEQLPPHQCEPS